LQGIHFVRACFLIFARLDRRDSFVCNVRLQGERDPIKSKKLELKQQQRAATAAVKVGQTDGTLAGTPSLSIVSYPARVNKSLVCRKVPWVQLKRGRKGHLKFKDYQEKKCVQLGNDYMSFLIGQVEISSRRTSSFSMQSMDICPISVKNVQL
jgi:hypothetical protein